MQSGLTQQVLERAIDNDELILYYQPKVSLLDGSIVGAEALVRWNVGEGVYISPSAFIPLAESSGLLHDLTVRLLDQVVSASEMLNERVPGLALSMNVAPNDLQSGVITERIKQVLDQKLIHPSALQIEITESAVMGNFEQIKEGIIQLTDMGVDVLMDDFGTGYSSIDRLSQLPFSALKLDQGIVKRMGESRQNLNVVKSCILMAQELRMTSVAEGIESSAAYQFLMANGCEVAQGYYISRPIALYEFISFAEQDHEFEGSQIGRIHQTVHNVLFYRKCLSDVVFCARQGADACLPSIVDPDLTESIEQSRLGRWYFGAGQRLSGMESFDRLEQPIRDLHKIGGDILNAMSINDSHSEQNATYKEMDGLVNKVVALLHALESDLILSQYI